ncbi:hypothetical protein ScPMuIL_005209, partial [Solemya velum]
LVERRLYQSTEDNLSAVHLMFSSCRGRDNLSHVCPRVEPINVVNSQTAQGVVPTIFRGQSITCAWTQFARTKHGVHARARENHRPMLTVL